MRQFESITVQGQKKEGEHLKYNTHKTTILSWVAPYLLFLLGLFCIVPYMLTDNLIIRGIQVLVFFVVASCIKHVRLLYFIILTITITMFYLFNPDGKVLFEYGFITITQGALYAGSFRGLTLMGYVFLSLWCISPDLKLPTKYGVLLGKSIMYFDAIIEISTNSDYKNFIKTQKEEYSNSSKETTRKKNKMNIAKNLVARTDMVLRESVMYISKMMNDKSTTQKASSSIRRTASRSKKHIVLGIFAIMSVIISAWLGFILDNIQ